MTGAATRRIGLLVAVVVALAAAAYLYDPPWVGSTTSGMRGWEEEGPGIRFRWTNGHGSFFVPSDARTMLLPIRAAFATAEAPVVVHLSVDDRPLTDLVLNDPAEWKQNRVPLPRRATRRRYRRIDLRVSRVVGPFNLGVQVGEVYFPDLLLRRSAQ